MKNYLSALAVLVLLNCSKTVTNEEYRVPDDYRAWKKPTDKILDYIVPGHGKSARIIYANDEFYNVKINEVNGVKRYSFNDGTVIIKEVYPDKDAVRTSDPMLTIMVKNSKSPDAIHGWLYYMQNPKTDIMEVNTRMCVGCHEAANDTHPYFDKNPNQEFRDFVFVINEK
ncbi:MAG: cytochrome P460 family protein [Spirochaetes bacterium]|nr:cytochrome P460 family protein [Spirochaetota bacterium]